MILEFNASEAKQEKKIFENLPAASEDFFLSRRGQIIYFQHFRGQNIFFQKVPPQESKGRPITIIRSNPSSSIQ